jgi:hypothetical protein
MVPYWCGVLGYKTYMRQIKNAYCLPPGSKNFRLDKSYNEVFLKLNYQLTKAINKFDKISIL